MHPLETWPAWRIGYLVKYCCDIISSWRSYDVFTHTLGGCFVGTACEVTLNDMRKIGQYQPRTKHKKMWTVSLFLALSFWMFCYVFVWNSIRTSEYSIEFNFSLQPSTTTLPSRPTWSLNPNQTEETIWREWFNSTLLWLYCQFVDRHVNPVFNRCLSVAWYRSHWDNWAARAWNHKAF